MSDSPKFVIVIEAYDDDMKLITRNYLCDYFESYQNQCWGPLDMAIQADPVECLRMLQHICCTHRQPNRYVFPQELSPNFQA